MRRWRYKHSEWCKGYDEMMACATGEREFAGGWEPDITDDEWDESYDGAGILCAETREDAVKEFWSDIGVNVYCVLHDC